MEVVPFMLSLRGHQMRTVELSLLRCDEGNMFLTKPECAPPVEQKWRVAPLRWSAEREPFVILTHRETCRLRLVVAKPDSACELWPVMYSSDQPDGGIENCPVSPARCKLVPFMWNNGLCVAALERESGKGAVLQINAPTEKWVFVKELTDERLVRTARLTPYYRWTSEGVCETLFLVQRVGAFPEVWKLDPVTGDWALLTTIADNRNGPLASSKVLFTYCKTPGGPLAVFATWIDGCNLYVAHVRERTENWEIISCVPTPPHGRLCSVYLPSLAEPLVVASSKDPNYVGSVAVRRLFLSEYLLEGKAISPRIERFMQVPAIPVVVRDLTADLPVTDLPYREFPPQRPAVVSQGILPPPPRAVSHDPIPLLHASGALAVLQEKARLDYVPLGDALSSPRWKVTPLRWAPPGREVLFVILQSTDLRCTRVAIASPEASDPDLWPVQVEFRDSSVPFSECALTPFQYQTAPGASDLFVLAVHEASGKGGIFFVANPKSEWQFVREDTDLRNVRSVMYHRSKDPASLNVCTFFLLDDGQVRVLVEPNLPTIEIARHEGISTRRNIVVLYAFAPKPPVTHVWPCEVLVGWIDAEGSLVVAHVASPEGEWRIITSLALPRTVDSISPVYLPYLAEPVLLLTFPGGEMDMIRLNLVAALMKTTSSAGGPRFIHRYLTTGTSRGPLTNLTLDAPLVWIPQMGIQGMHPYCGHPLPFEQQ